MIRELKNELEDKEEELNNLKRKSKVTKVNELEVTRKIYQKVSCKQGATQNFPGRKSEIKNHY